jgi:hypothetical protein
MPSNEGRYRVRDPVPERPLAPMRVLIRRPETVSGHTEDRPSMPLAQQGYSNVCRAKTCANNQDSAICGDRAPPVVIPWIVDPVAMRLYAAQR